MADKKPTQEIHDCSNCRFSKEAVPYKVLLECEIDTGLKLQPYTCSRWMGIFGQLVSNEEVIDIS